MSDQKPPTPESGEPVFARVPAYVSCPLGGIAPCVDDLCHGGGTTLCGLEYGYDFCEHNQDPESCTECRDERGEWDDFSDD